MKIERKQNQTHFNHEDMELERFLTDLLLHVNLPESEQENLRAIWPDAKLAAIECEEKMPSIGWMSFRKRYKAFLVVCSLLDELQNHARIDDEQAQLALTIIRRRNRSYRKAESMFAARARRLGLEERQKLPLTAQQLIYSGPRNQDNGLR